MIRSIYNYLTRFVSPQFIKFCVVGGLGTITDASIFYILSSAVKTNSIYLINLLPMFGYSAAVLQNYVINHYWTFSGITKETGISKKGFFTFLTVSLLSLMPRYAVFNFCLYLLNSSLPIMQAIANLMGIGAGTIVNFFGSKYIVFRDKSPKS